MSDLILKEESYTIIGKCMDVHNNLGRGFTEIVYKDALELEFKEATIPFEREKKYEVSYKGAVLRHHFYADFVVYDQIILEVKSTKVISQEFVAQTMNYLKVSDNPLAIIVNFGETQLKYKRLVL